MSNKILCVFLGNVNSKNIKFLFINISNGYGHGFYILKFPNHPVLAETSKKKDITEVTQEVTPEVTPEVKRLLEAMTGDHSRRELQELLRLKDAEHFRKTYLLKAIDTGLVEMTLPDKPKSSLQKYRLTQNGLEYKK